MSTATRYCSDCYCLLCCSGSAFAAASEERCLRGAWGPTVASEKPMGPVRACREPCRPARPRAARCEHPVRLERRGRWGAGSHLAGKHQPPDGRRPGVQVTAGETNSLRPLGGIRERPLFSQAQAINDLLISFPVHPVQIREKAGPCPNHFQQPAARGMILLVHLEMLSELLDPGGQQRHLNFRRTRVLVMPPVGPNQFGLVGYC
jgi:hypothetical protein